jgi:ATPase subunit of ABC transporter with duplicated ATPase domains
MLFVSHDRTFLRGLSNRVLELHPDDGDHRPKIFLGGYAEYVVATGQEAPGVHA